MFLSMLSVLYFMSQNTKEGTRSIASKKSEEIDMHNSLWGEIEGE